MCLYSRLFRLNFKESAITRQMLFDRQYTLTETVVTETRYDAEGDPYTWYICYVTLES